MSVLCLCVCMERGGGYTCQRQDVEPLEAVSAGGRVATSFGKTPLATGQHGGRRDDTGRGHLPHPLIQLLDLLLLHRLERLHLTHVSDGQGERGMKGETKKTRE